MSVSDWIFTFVVCPTIIKFPSTVKSFPTLNVFEKVALFDTLRELDNFNKLATNKSLFTVLDPFTDKVWSKYTDLATLKLLLSKVALDTVKLSLTFVELKFSASKTGC